LLRRKDLARQVDCVSSKQTACIPTIVYLTCPICATSSSVNGVPLKSARFLPSTAFA
jgi:hypothetical protein